MKRHLYVYPRLPSKAIFLIRIFGSGLANCLFAYGRAVVLADRLKLPLIAPDWIQFKIGPYVRFERDKRHYAGLFRRDGIGGIRKQWLLLTAKKIDERAADSATSGVIVVDGLGDYFESLHTHSALVRERLLSIVTPASIAQLPAIPTPSIGIHVRLGDYDADMRVPLEWYVRMIRLARERLGAGVPVLVFSDGTPEELAPVLAEPGTSYVNYGNAIADILALSQTSLILASDSTFSAWAAYLRQVPVIFSKRHFKPVLDNPAHDYVQGSGDDEGVRKWLSTLSVPA